jgi:hypothetical protein
MVVGCGGGGWTLPGSQEAEENERERERERKIERDRERERERERGDKIYTSKLPLPK